MTEARLAWRRATGNDLNRHSIARAMLVSPNEPEEVSNQSPPLEDVGIFLADQALQEAVGREGAAWAVDELTKLGAWFGRTEIIELGNVANRFPPILHTHDRFGRRRDEVEFHPAWHEVMTIFMQAGIHTSAWSEPRPGAHVARAAAYFLCSQVESGAQCPLTMTFAAVPVLRRHGGAIPMLVETWLPRIFSREYDRRFAPVSEKKSALIGMGMTEKQGGSDVRTNTTRAVPSASTEAGGSFLLTGHKWFFSAPMCDSFLVLAQAPGGLSCFFVPRFLPDGTRNALHLQRLKEKLGNRSNASSEVEFAGAHGWLLGEEGRGVPTIVEMVNHTRLDCVLGSAGIMRLALSHALHHASHRVAFGRRLIEQPLMRNVLTDLALESEAATALGLRLARAFDAGEDSRESALRRLLTPAAKYWICKRGPGVAAEAMEVLGGNGYVEESVMPRLYRELPVNSIWEGSGNVMGLDMLRAATKTPDALEAVFAEIELARGADPRMDRFAVKLRDAFARDASGEANARRLAESLVLGVQASLLVRFAPPAVADAFCASRLERDWGGAFGTLPAGLNAAAILQRAWPRLLPA